MPQLFPDGLSQLREKPRKPRKKELLQVDVFDKDVLVECE